MPRRRSIFPSIVNAAIFILMEIAALNLLSRNSSLQEIWIAQASHKFMGAVWGGSQSIRSYFTLRSENEALAAENHELRKRLMEISTSTDSSVQLTGDTPYSFFSANIVKISRNKQHNYIIIDKGSENGVTDRCGIISSKGVIGIVDAVGPHHAFALSFRNADVSISARLGNEGAVGPLVWDGRSSDGAIMKEIPLQYKYHPGDTVYTSGYSSIFPPDIPLGLAGESRVINGATNEIRVKLFQDFSSLRYVTVVKNNNAREMEALER